MATKVYVVTQYVETSCDAFSDYLKVFSTKEAAEHYVHVLSMQDEDGLYELREEEVADE